jgi:DNA primase
VSARGGLFTPATVERVKEAADIVEIVSAYTDLRRSGARFMGLCPFHDERSPSFSVDAQAKLYHCFACGVGGDVIKFVEEKEGLSFPEAVESLAERYGVEIEREASDPRAEEARRRRARLTELLARTAEFYAKYLRESPQAAKARAYLAGRGLDEGVLADFGVGFAPSAWDRVLTAGQRAGYSIAELEAAGLVQKGRKGGHYDRFRARITFPVRDPRARVQGFGARALSTDSKPKYLNSPEGDLYRKSRTLYGIDRARAEITKRGRAVVVEGYTDVLAAHQAGITETVAVMGTAITPEQLRLLASYATEVVLALDADRAGREAMLRAQRVAGARRLRLRVAAMPAGEDPADLLESGDPGPFRSLIDGAVDVPVFHVRAILDEADLASPAGRDQALDEAVPVLAGMGETISRDELAREVADRLDADPALVMRRLTSGSEGTLAAATSTPEIVSAPRALNARERIEHALLAMCVREPALGREFVSRLRDEHLSSEAMRNARRWLADHLDNPLHGMPRDDPELLRVVTDLKMSAEREPASREAMELNFLLLEREMVEEQIAAAERAGGPPPVDLQRQRAELTERVFGREAVRGS